MDARLTNNRCKHYHKIHPPIRAVEDLVRSEIESSEKKLTLLNEPELYLALDVRVAHDACVSCGWGGVPRDPMRGDMVDVTEMGR